jgi:hypothetical protein
MWGILKKYKLKGKTIRLAVTPLYIVSIEELIKRIIAG